MGLSLLLGLAVAAQPEAVIGPTRSLVLHGRQIRLGDLARVRGVGAAVELERRIVATLPESRPSVTLSRAALLGLIRRAVPGLAVRGGPASLIIRRDRSAAPPSSTAACFALAAPVAAGAAVRPSDLAPIACTKGESVALRFDRRSASVRAAAPLPAGAYLGRIAPPPPPEIERGQSLVAVSTVGPVRIERPVVALQPARNGARGFVRDEAGEVFSAPVSVSTEDRP